MFYMIDNYDSFVYNLAAYFQELGCPLKILRNDQVNLNELKQLAKCGTLEGIILSPGPKSPQESGCCREIVKQLHHQVPILGVCLGHQIIGHVLGAQIQKGKIPMHGKVTPLNNNQTGLFTHLPTSFQVTRYHSLVVDSSNLPDCLAVDACTEDGTIMAIHHRQAPLYGVQFHPEAVLTEYGHELLRNFLIISQNWRAQHAG